MAKLIFKSFRQLLWRITRYCGGVLVCLLVFYLGLTVYILCGKAQTKRGLFSEAQ